MIDAQRLTAHFIDKYGLASGSFDVQTPLFSSNMLDSFSMVDLIMFLEKSTGMRLNPADVTLDNLDSIERILDFVSKQAAG
jgi:acyl carrier protein